MNKMDKQTIIKNRSKNAKKSILVMTTVASLAVISCVGVFAASGDVDTTNFIQSAMTVLKTLISLIGAGVGIWGIVNLIEGYSSDNPGAKSQGIKQFVSGLALIILAVVMVPILQSMFLGAI